MDDDLTFGTSVWGSEATLDVVSPTKPPISLSTTIPSAPGSDFDDSGFDDFEDFNTAPTSAVEVNDDFGDFEEFGDDVAVATGFHDQGFLSGPQQESQALVLDPLPERSELEAKVKGILEPVWAGGDISQVTTDEPIREAEGVAQILVTPESREMYKVLLQTPPPIKPPNWTRSRIRRQHLIALGIPVNLDEMLPRANGKPLPPLEITTRPSSTPPSVSARNSMSAQPSRSGTPQPSRQNSMATTTQFGPKPELDLDKINMLLKLDIEMLNIQPLAVLERHLADFKGQTASTSNLLAYLLQTKDALQQDAETYNGLIAELVGEAQKMKSGKPRTVGSRRSGVV